LVVYTIKAGFIQSRHMLKFSGTPTAHTCMRERERMKNFRMCKNCIAFHNKLN